LSSLGFGPILTALDIAARLAVADPASTGCQRDLAAVRQKINNPGLAGKSRKMERASSDLRPADHESAHCWIQESGILEETRWRYNRQMQYDRVSAT
jgi:hypothetical protein